jgi:drug/metabolite transporter superfamily protein YnfA
MKSSLAALIVAAALEIGGDAAVRRGLIQSASLWLLLGATMLIAYGFLVNVNRSMPFGRLMGLYIAVFFIVSQLVSMALFAERPSLGLLAGGALIVAGGLVIQFAAQ